MDSAWVLTPEDDIFTLLGDISNLQINYPTASSVYADNTGLSVGSISFDTAWFNGINELQGEFLRAAPASSAAGLSFLATNVSTSSGTTSISGVFGDLAENVYNPVSLNFNFDFAYCKISDFPNGFGVHTVRFYDTSGTVIHPMKVPEGFTDKYPAGMRFALNPGNGLNVITQFCQSTGIINLAGTSSDFPTTLSPLIDYSELTTGISQGQPSKYVDVVQYQGGYDTQVEIFPVADEEAQIIQVEANETVVVDLTLNSWVISVNQPTCIDFVEADINYYDGTDGVYAVAGNDNRPIPASQWNATGGDVSVAKHPTDPKVIQVTVRGMADGTYGPFRLAMTSGNYYNALRITGDAVIGNPVTHRFYTGVDPLLTNSEVPITVDYPCVQTLEQAYSVGMRAARQYTGLVYSLGGSGGNETEVLDLVELDNRRYLILSSNGDETSIRSFSGEPLDLMEFFEEVWDNGVDTMADFEAQWPRATKTMKDFMISYLKRDV